MTTNKSVAFVLVDGQYKEIPSSCVLHNSRLTAEYASRHFINECGYLMEVSRDDWIQFKRDDERTKYLNRQAKKRGQFNYHAFDSGICSGEELIIDITTNVEDDIIRQIMVDEVDSMISQLPVSEQALIQALFFDNLTEAEYAKIIGVSRQHLNQQKNNILRKLKIKLEK